jgi:hypothetical protein
MAKAENLRKLFEADWNGNSMLEIAEILTYANRTLERPTKGQDVHSLLLELDGIAAQRQKLLLPVKAIGEPPQPRSRGLHTELKPTAI